MLISKWFIDLRVLEDGYRPRICRLVGWAGEHCERERTESLYQAALIAILLSQTSHAGSIRGSRVSNCYCAPKAKFI